MGDERFLYSDFGVRHRQGWRGPKMARMTDVMFDARLLVSGAFHDLRAEADRMPVQRVAVLAVDVPGRESDLAALLAELKLTRHTVLAHVVPMGDRGKFANINLGLPEVEDFAPDWIVVVDDDVALPAKFLDRFLYCCAAADLRIAQPAHRFRSHTNYTITQRQWGALVHKTRFVECGPITAFHRSVFSDVLPFPETRWAWGLDAIWAKAARARGFDIGIVDATPLRHLRPVAGGYSSDLARDEANALLEAHHLRLTSREVLVTCEVLGRLKPRQPAAVRAS